jgi:hypothetical protein
VADHRPADKGGELLGAVGAEPAAGAGCDQNRGDAHAATLAARRQPRQSALWRNALLSSTAVPRCSRVLTGSGNGVNV